MEREVLKSHLDHLADNSELLLGLLNHLSNGPTRQLTFSKRGLILSLEDGNLQFHWHPEDPRTAIASLVVKGTYEPVVTDLFTQLLPNLNEVLDVGANVGYYSIMFGVLGHERLTIHAFEPFMQSIEVLEANLKLNELSAKVTVHKFALGNSDGTAQLFVPKRSGTSAASLADLHPDEQNSVVTIETRRLDSMFPSTGLNNLDLIKIDVEGAEAQVLEGGWGTISKFKPMIFAELLRKWSSKFGYHPNEVIHSLASLGYQCFAVGEKLRLIKEINEETPETNFFFLGNSNSHVSTRERLRSIGLIH